MFKQKGNHATGFLSWSSFWAGLLDAWGQPFSAPGCTHILWLSSPGLPLSRYPHVLVSCIIVIIIIIISAFFSIPPLSLSFFSTCIRLHHPSFHLLPFLSILHISLLCSPFPACCSLIPDARYDPWCSEKRKRKLPVRERAVLLFCIPHSSGPDESLSLVSSSPFISIKGATRVNFFSSFSSCLSSCSHPLAAATRHSLHHEDDHCPVFTDCCCISQSSVWCTTVRSLSGSDCHSVDSIRPDSSIHAQRLDPAGFDVQRPSCCSVPVHHTGTHDPAPLIRPRDRSGTPPGPCSPLSSRSSGCTTVRSLETMIIFMINLPY